MIDDSYLDSFTEGWASHLRPAMRRCLAENKRPVNPKDIHFVPVWLPTLQSDEPYVLSAIHAVYRHKDAWHRQHFSVGTPKLTWVASGHHPGKPHDQACPGDEIEDLDEFIDTLISEGSWEAGEAIIPDTAWNDWTALHERCIQSLQNSPTIHQQWGTWRKACLIPEPPIRPGTTAHAQPFFLRFHTPLPAKNGALIGRINGYHVSGQPNDLVSPNDAVDLAYLAEMCRVLTPTAPTTQTILANGLSPGTSDWFNKGWQEWESQMQFLLTLPVKHTIYPPHEAMQSYKAWAERSKRLSDSPDQESLDTSLDLV